MKKFFALSPVIILVILLFTACNHHTEGAKDTDTVKDTTVVKGADVLKGEVDIKDAAQNSNSILPNGNVSGHKNGDVEVSKIMLTEKAYKVTYYQMESDSLQMHGATYGSANDFNKAAYHWENDTLHMRLYNSDGTGNELKFKLYGHGGSNAMADEK